MKASVEREQLYAGRGKKVLIKDVEGLFSAEVVITERYVRIDFGEAATTSEFVLEVEDAFENLIERIFYEYFVSVGKENRVPGISADFIWSDNECLGKR